jgi:uncharacterized protein (TIGR03084 family)
VREIVAALAEQHAELYALVDDLTESELSGRSACAGWSISDVLLHLMQTDGLAYASAEGRFHEEVRRFTDVGGRDLDDNVDALVRAERGMLGRAVVDEWWHGARFLRDKFADVEPNARVTWVAGTMAARSLATTRLAECWIHTGDIAEPLGRPIVASPRLWHVARLAWRTLPHAFGREGRTLAGPVAFRLAGPGDRSWTFEPAEPAVTVVEGDGLDLVLVAARRKSAADSTLTASGPDADAVLELVRTWA